jgi:hypothetical protein
MRNDAFGAVAEFAASRHGVITRHQAADMGMSWRVVRTRLREGVLREPRPGVLVSAAAPRTWRQDLLVASLCAGGQLVASHRAAARLHGLDGFGPGPLELTVARPGRARLDGAILHHVAALDRRDVLTIDAIRTTGLARTLCDLGSVVPPDLVERALDDARRRDMGLRWVRETALRLHRPGQAGTKVLLRLLDEAAKQPTVRGSWFEKLVELCLDHPALPPLERQYTVLDDAGRSIGRVDLAFPAIRLAVEAHSREFHFGSAAEAADENRDNCLAARGWEVLYVGYQGLRQPEEVLQIVLETASQRTGLLQR